MAIECEDQELLDGFLAETAELLDKLDDDLVSLEKRDGDAELLNRIFRSIHTIKGASSFLGFELLVKVTHKTEDVLNRLRRGELSVTPEMMDVLLEAVDLVKVLVADIRGGEIVERELSATIEKLLLYLPDSGTDVATTPPPTPASSAPPVETPASEEKKAAKSKKKKADDKKETAVTPAPTENKIAEAEVKDDFSDRTTVRVDVKRLDDLMNQMGELVLERNRIIQMNTDYQTEVNISSFGEEFAKLTKRVDFVTSELQMQVLKMRMIPVGNIFKKFPRIVRNLCRDLGKEMELQIVGEETELDRSVIDEIGDPLIHLIRNALDHGIETPAERIAAGKERKGTLILSARHEGNQIVISVKDDGRGIDVERVSRKAVDKGLVTEEDLLTMGQREILDFIFQPGFSTKEKATDVSGRGVGMDVVRTNIKRLNGIIDIKNNPGEGAEFILKLPLTLAIIQSLLVEVDNETYSIPLSAVIETLRVEDAKFHLVGGQEVLKRNDSVLPLVRLREIFGVGGEREKKLYCYVVVVGVAERRVGLVVTRLLGQQEVAIKSLGRYLGNVPGIAGSTILGDGRVTLIIDPAKIMEISSNRSRLAA